MIRMYLIVDPATETIFVDKERGVISHLSLTAERKAYFVDVTTEPPTLTEAKLGKKNDIIAQVVIKDLVVDGKSVVESQIQETLKIPEPKE